MAHNRVSLESSSLLSFREQAAIPQMDYKKEAYQKGFCGFNIDGKCISGGDNVAGASGYRLSSMGYPSQQAAAEGSSCSGCHSFPLWFKANTPYELAGWDLKTNRKPLIGRNYF